MDGLSLESFFKKHSAQLPKLLQDALGNSISVDVSRDVLLASVEEIGDGNLNVVYRARLESVGTVIVKYAPGYIKILGPSYPLTQSRCTVEHAALVEYHKICPVCVPVPVMFDAESSTIVMEDLGDYTIMRQELLKGHVNHDAITSLMTSLATVHGRTTQESLGPDGYQRLCKVFNNEDMVAITEQYIFTKPYLHGDATNRHHLMLNEEVELLRASKEACHRAEEMKRLFTGYRQCLCHGDLHTGSVMAKDDCAKMFDMEFAFMGPAAFDFGMFVANLLFALVRHIELGNREAIDSINKAIECSVNAYCLTAAAGGASGGILEEDFVSQTVGFIGCELIRRVIGAAHVEDLKEMPKGELVALRLGRMFLLWVSSDNTSSSSKSPGERLLDIIKAVLSQKQLI